VTRRKAPTITRVWGAGLPSALDYGCKEKSRGALLETVEAVATNALQRAAQASRSERRKTGQTVSSEQ